MKKYPRRRSANEAAANTKEPAEIRTPKLKNSVDGTVPNTARNENYTNRKKTPKKYARMIGYSIPIRAVFSSSSKVGGVYRSLNFLIIGILFTDVADNLHWDT